jgi:hypothetical protein
MIIVPVTEMAISNKAVHMAQKDAISPAPPEF